jgi:hypothetical protein
VPDDLYERDFYAWAMREPACCTGSRRASGATMHWMRRISLRGIESLGRRERREISSRLSVLLTHMLKWQHQPDARSGSLRATTREQRDELEAVLEDSPSRRSIVPERIASAFRRASRKAEDETGLQRSAFPADCTYTPQQVLDPDYLPEPLAF